MAVREAMKNPISRTTHAPPFLQVIAAKPQSLQNKIMSGNVKEEISPLADIESESVVDGPNDFKPSLSNAPGPVSIIKPIEEEHCFELNEECLERILLNPKVADKKVSVISVAGAFRKGKSFLLNFFLRYLKHRCREKNETGNWLESEPNLQGFSWRGGCERDTNGIVVWSEPFVLEDKNGEEVAVILMDTQGSFDSQSTVKECATIFALSTMISSLQIFNISHNIQEDDLQHLQLFTEYGRLALEDNIQSKPFQSLLFVVRDWSCPYEAVYGFAGGEQILNRRLEVNDKKHPELQQLRKHIRASFDDLRCFLMPHPGLKVATDPQFKGELSDIQSDFLTHLRTMVTNLLDSNNIVVKCINGRSVTCRELVVYFKAYTEMFNGEELPEPKSMLAATAEANNLAAAVNSTAYYMNQMEQICGGDAPYMGAVELEGHHARHKEEAIHRFQTTKKMGGEELSQQFLDKLYDDIEDAFENFAKMNNSKNLLKFFKFPAVSVIAIMICYVMKEISRLTQLDAAASVFDLFILITIMLLSAWMYSRYSGTLLRFRRKIEECVEWIIAMFSDERIISLFDVPFLVFLISNIFLSLLIYYIAVKLLGFM
ncbi:atlastin-2 [Ditylenchus destructor]|uniref:Atlastin-2 n=1 Tax=Ditylenchus destructor TaxID=166010 RepID=A0AAD4QY03_9BILA|nr:atlastin-2 [Ditylenchus destructor]